MVQNKGLIFKAVPDGVPVVGKHIAVETGEFDLDQAPPEGGIITKNFYASYDPYQMGRIDIHRKSYIPPFTLGQPIGNFTIAKVLKSDSAKFKPSDIVVGQIKTEEYSATEKWVVDTYIQQAVESIGPGPDIVYRSTWNAKSYCILIILRHWQASQW